MYPGGKGNCYQRIVNEMPPHSLYVEAFLGSGAVMRAKLPARRNVGIDLDGEALAAFPPMAGVELIQADAVAWLRAFPFVGNELVYCDPPYVMESRRDKRALYRYEFTTAQHEDLLACLLALPCAVLISGYASPLYVEALADWRLVTFTAQTRGGVPALEHLWCNFPEPVALHDYRYLGDNYRERERIKRKSGRWRARLAGMDILERRALLWAIRDAGSFDTG